MAQLRFSKHINAPPETVCALATDLERLSEVIRAIRKIEVLTPGSVGLGTRFRETRLMFGRESTQELEFTAYVPPRRFTLKAQSHGVLVVCEHHFVPDIAGTLVELKLRVQRMSLTARLMAPVAWLMSGGIKQQIESDLNDLKAAAEKRAPVDWSRDPSREHKGYETSGK